MSSGLSSTLSEFAKKSEFAKNPLATEGSDEQHVQPARLNLGAQARAWLGRLVSLSIARYLLAFAVGVAATLAWQSYSDAARKMIAGWSPHLTWLAPAAAPRGISPDRVKTASLALAAVQQSVDKLATEIGKLDMQSGSERAPTSAPPRRGSRRP